MTLVEFVLVFLIGGVIILATVGRDRSVTNCTCAVIAIGSMHRLVSWLRIRFPRFGLWIDGVPLTLVCRGEYRHDMLQRTRMAPEDVMASARLNGIRSFEQIEYAFLERNGGISVFKREEEGTHSGGQEEG